MSAERMRRCLRGFGFMFQDSCSYIFADVSRLALRPNESFIFICAHMPFFLLRQPVSCTAATGCQGFHRMNYLEANPLCQWGIENKLQPFQSGNKSCVSGHGVAQRSANSLLPFVRVHHLCNMHAFLLYKGITGLQFHHFSADIASTFSR
jgi:hypothetical protein